MGLFLPPTITSPDLKSSSLPPLVVRRPRSRLFSLLALSLLVFLYTHTSLIPRFSTSSSPSAVSAVPSPIPSSSLSDHDSLPPFEVPVPPKQKDRKVELTSLGERAERSYAHVGPESWEDYVHQLLGFVKANLPSVESETRRWLSYGTSSPPQDEGNMRIPLSLWQTSKSYSKSLKFGSLHLGSWRKKHGDALNQTFYNDDGITKSSLVNASPLIRETVANLSSIHIQMSDFWRYLILAREGGIYSDADTRCLKEAWKWSWIGGSLEAEFVRERESRWAHFLRMLGRPGSEASPWAVEESSRESEEGAGERKVVPFEKAGKKGWWHRLFGGDEDGKKKGKDGKGWVKDEQRGIWYEEQFQDGVGLIVGIEADVGDRIDWYDWYPRPLQFVQWTIASARGHPVALDVVRRISSPPPTETIDPETGLKTHSIMERTGPGVWTDAVLSYLQAKYGVHWSDLRSLEPNGGVRYGDVVIRGINAFSPGVGAMGSGTTADRGALVEHGFWGTWKNQVKGTEAE